MNAVDVQKIVVRYGRQEVLHEVDIAIDEGEAVALLGANGSGKSTLVKAILGLVPTVAGTVNLFGTNNTRFRAWERIGYVPQRLGVGGGVPATVTEVVSAGRLARRRILFPATRRDKTIVAEALDAVGLTSKAREPVATLSGGQQQRVLIARALAGEPDLLVMDEPTAGVDADNQELFAKILAEQKTGGCALLLVAHELGPLFEVMDRAIVLASGQVTHDGEVPRIRDHGGEHVHGVTTYDERWSVT